MHVLICLAVGVAAGMFLGGFRALRYARAQDFPQAIRTLRRSALAAAAVTALGSFLLLGWPLKSQTVAVPEEVSRTILETVEVVVEVPTWIFFTTTKTETREVPKVVVETIVRNEARDSFSPWLLIPMGLVAWGAVYLELRFVRLLYRWY